MMAAVRPHTGATPAEASGFDRMLRRFARPERPRYGVGIGPGEDGLDPLREVLREIDETMLPRRIALACRPGGEVRLVVSNRRLLSIETAGGPVAAKGETPAEAVRHFARVLLDCMKGCKKAVLQPPERLGAFDSPDISCSAALLAEAAGLEGWGGDEAAPDGDFFGAAREAALAWLDAGQDMAVSASGGPEDGTGRLMQVLDSIARSRAGARKPQFGTRAPQCACIPLGGAETLFVATERERCFLALVPDTHMAGLAETWHVYSAAAGKR